MDEEQALLDALAASPDDEPLRQIYADWLEEQGDPRAPFVRASRGVPRCRALISDVHANLEALQAVLADIAALGVRSVYSLGDMIGYGPNPRECLDLLMNCEVALMGNHDHLAIFDPPGFSPSAERASYWTRKQLRRGRRTDPAGEQRWEFLADRSQMYREGDFLFVHASPRHPLHEYLFPEDIYNEIKLERIFALVERWCFHGHTHIPGIILEGGAYIHPPDVNHVFHLDERKALCDVGSVGQPRDGDPRASYVLLVGRTVFFRRVGYDVEKTIRKIHGEDDLDDFLGDRLRDGR
ncbi:MAG: metallophosphoesterase family protein [Gemmataceae bacterium]|nr:metallophosphoesterase family protein [Gemmataceae bacterium]